MALPQKSAGDAMAPPMQVGAMRCRLLDRTPSERSEASWSFNISTVRASLPGMGIDDESDQVP